MHTNNRTQFKTLDKVAADKRVKRVEQDSDGIWAYLVDGYNFEGCSAVRGDTTSEVLADFDRVEEGEPY